MESMYYMLFGGALVLAGLFIGARLMPLKQMQEKHSPAAAAEPGDFGEEELKKAQALRDQWNNLMNYDGRDQKAGK